MVLQENISLFCLAKSLTVSEFAFCHCRAKSFAAAREFKYLPVVEPVLHGVALGDDPDRVPVTSGFGGSSLGGQQVIEIRQAVWAADVLVVVVVVELVFEAKLSAGVREVLDAAVDIALEVGIHFVFETQVEIGVLLSGDDATLGTFGSTVTGSANDLAVFDKPATFRNCGLLNTLEIVKGVAVEEQCKALLGFLLRERVGRYRLMPLPCFLSRALCD